jgi:hypothetical protein
VAGGAREGHQVRPQAAGGAAGLLDRGQHQPADPGEAGAAPAEPGQLACTPAAAQYDLLEPADIAIVTLDGEQVDGHKPPTSELRMHRMFCKYRPEIGAIVHTHGKAVMTFANLGWMLPPILTGLYETTGGAVLTSPYSQPGTDQMYTYNRACPAGPGRYLPALPRPAGHRRGPRARVPHRGGRRGGLRGVPQRTPVRPGGGAPGRAGRMDRLLLAGAVPWCARAAAHSGSAAGA